MSVYNAIQIADAKKKQPCSPDLNLTPFAA